ncbi:carbohydrate kinase [Desulfococcaceae bacterium HSG8]|nr:carbohydrate kinase [Desulfococcaceae bacterium HSG8]
MILTIGEILFDIFPKYKRLGGAPFNFSFHLKSLGLPVTFASRVGNDGNGDNILKIIKENGFDPKFIQIDPAHETGHVNVTLNEKGIPAFDIVKDVAYDYLSYTSEIKNILKEDVRMIYYGTLVQRTARGADTIIRTLRRRNVKTKCFYDMNLRPDSYNDDVIKVSLAYCDILKLNQEELAILKGILRIEENDDDFIAYLTHKLAIEWVSLTKGDKGSVLYTSQEKYSSEEIGDAITPADTVGAGDGYASILAMGYLNGWEPELILKRAGRFAGAICEIKGAIPDDEKFYRRFPDWTK